MNMPGSFSPQGFSSSVLRAPFLDSSIPSSQLVVCTGLSGGGYFSLTGCSLSLSMELNCGVLG